MSLLRRMRRMHKSGSSNANVGQWTRRSVTGKISNARNLTAGCKNCTTRGNAVHCIEYHLMTIQKIKQVDVTKSDINKRGVVGGKKTKLKATANAVML